MIALRFLKFLTSFLLELLLYPAIYELWKQTSLRMPVHGSGAAGSGAAKDAPGVVAFSSGLTKVPDFRRAG